MPTAGNHASKHSYSSSVAPGPPCNSSTFRSGLVPTRLVQTRNVPRGVSIGTIRDPPETTSRVSQDDVSKYGSGGDPTAAPYSLCDQRNRFRFGRPLERLKA